MGRQKVRIDQLVVPPGTPDGHRPAVVLGELIYEAPSTGGGGGSSTPNDTTLTRAAAQALTTSTWTDVIWDTQETDPLNAWTSGASIIVPSGKTRARITAAVAWSNSTAGTRYVRAYNFTTDASYGGDIRTATNEALSTVSTPWVPVVAGNDLRLRVLTSTAASLSGPGFGGPTRISVEWQ